MARVKGKQSGGRKRATVEPHPRPLWGEYRGDLLGKMRKRYPGMLAKILDRSMDVLTKGVEANDPDAVKFVMDLDSIMRSEPVVVSLTRDECRLVISMAWREVFRRCACCARPSQASALAASVRMKTEKALNETER